MRIRISYNKDCALRFTSALDMQLIWERSFRRASIVLIYSKGFHPKPRIQLGIPLPLGFTGTNEKVDVWIEDNVQVDTIAARLEKNLPSGLVITNIEAVPISEKPLSSKIQFSEYRVFFYDQSLYTIELKDKISNLLKKKEIIRIKRNGKKYDLRPLILSAELLRDDQNRNFVFLRLLSQQNKTGRADEVMVSLGYSAADFLIERTGSFI